MFLFLEHVKQCLSPVPNANLGDKLSGELGLQDLPSPRQMLINYVGTDNKIDNSVHTAWQKELDAMGYPTQCTNIAVANGSECAVTQPFSPGQPLVDIHGHASTRFLGDILASIALPVAGGLLRQPSLFLSTLPGGNSFDMQITCNAQPDSGITTQQYAGSISYTKYLFGLIKIKSYLTNMTETSDPNTLPYDYFPGGYYPIQLNPADVNQSSNIGYAVNPNLLGNPFVLAQNPDSVFNAYVAEFLPYNVQLNAFQPSFCFVPVTSSLDIGKGTAVLSKADFLTDYMQGRPPLPIKNTPFSDFITAYNGTTADNEMHIDIRPRNGDFVAAKLTGGTKPYDCSDCIVDNVVIDGPSIFCSGGTYAIDNFASDYTITWTASPSGIVTINSPNNSQTTLTRLKDGQITLKASIFRPQCGTYITRTTTVAVGAPVGNITIKELGQTCEYDVNFSTTENGSSYLWSTNGSTYTSNIPILEVGQTGTIWAQVSNACGNISVSRPYNIQRPVNGANCNARPEWYGEVDSSTKTNTDFSLNIYPNPSINNLNVILKGTQSGEIQTQMIKEIDIFNAFGSMVKSEKFSNNQNININLSNMLAGEYILKVFDGVTWKVEKFTKMSGK
jgi:hypothetical protein